MKILKIKVKSGEKGIMLYPNGFLTIQCLEHIYCDDVENNICWLIVAINDEDFDKITDKTDVEELTVTDTETFTEKYDPHDTEITDEGIIRAIEIKTKIGTVLTSTELKALNPADSTPGICYRKRFIDKVKTRLKIK